MSYEKNINTDNIEKMKSKLEEYIPDINKLDQDSIKDVLINQIENNPNINQDIKDKINKGDMDGLKLELIKYLNNQNNSDESSEKIKNMLENNDYEGLQNQVMGMLMKGLSGQKKNEIEYKADKKVENETNTNPFSGLFNETFLNAAINKFSSENINVNDNRIVLLNSIKPFISDSRQKVIDECIKAISLLTTMEKLGFKVGK